MNLLCKFAEHFPHLAAEILERDRHKRRNFREETITDILMAGLVPFEPLGIKVDFPVNEAATGEDMDWEFVNEHAVDGRRYLRLHIQAKRARQSSGKKAPYWFYRELDHAVANPVTKSGSPPPAPLYGSQHERLVDVAAKTPGCIALYMFYHPRSALLPATGETPAVEGVNWMFADQVPKKLTKEHWPVADKKVEAWRAQFHPLTELLCFGDPDIDLIRVYDPVLPFLAFAIAGPSSIPSPGMIADRLNELRSGDDARVTDSTLVRPVEQIPEQTLARIRTRGEGRRSFALERPSVLFLSGADHDAALLKRPSVR